MDRKVYNVYKTLELKVKAESEEQAIALASKKFDEGYGIWGKEIDAYEIYDYDKYEKKLKTLEKFHGSDYEKEWLEIKREYDTGSISEAYHKLANLISKEEELKKYKARIFNTDLIIRYGRRDSEYVTYRLSGKYKIEQDIALCKEIIEQCKDITVVA